MAEEVRLNVIFDADTSSATQKTQNLLEKIQEAKLRGALPIDEGEEGPHSAIRELGRTEPEVRESAQENAIPGESGANDQRFEDLHSAIRELGRSQEQKEEKEGTPHEVVHELSNVSEDRNEGLETDHEKESIPASKLDDIHKTLQQLSDNIEGQTLAKTEPKDKDQEKSGLFDFFRKKERSPEEQEENHERLRQTREISKLTEVMRLTRRGAMGVIGSGGNLLQSGTSFMDDLGSFAGKLGPAGIIIGAVAAAGAITNALSEQYEKVMDPVMKQTAAFGELTGDADGNHKAFVASMDMASESAARFGYTIQDGIGALQNFSEAGMNRKDALMNLGNDFGYARMYGLDPSETSKADATFSRYLGGGKNFLGQAAYASEKEGLGPGQYKEFLDATLSIFEDGISKGITKGFGEVETAEVIFGHAGKTWQGQRGAQKIQAIDRGLESGTSLTSETDVLEYDVARRDMIKNGAKDPSYNQVFAWEEGGVSSHPEMFKDMMDAFAHYGPESMASMVHDKFGVNWNETNQLMDLYNDMKANTKNYDVDKEKVKNIVSAESPETQMLGKMEEIRNEIRDLGSGAILLKLGTLDLIEGTLGTIAGLLGGKGAGMVGTLSALGFKDVDKGFASSIDDDYKNMTPDQQRDYLSRMAQIGSYGDGAEGLAQMPFRGEPLAKYMAESERKGDKEGLSAAEKYLSMLRKSRGTNWKALNLQRSGIDDWWNNNSFYYQAFSDAGVMDKLNGAEAAGFVPWAFAHHPKSMPMYHHLTDDEKRQPDLYASGYRQEIKKMLQEYLHSMNNHLENIAGGTTPPAGLFVSGSGAGGSY